MLVFHFVFLEWTHSHCKTKTVWVRSFEIARTHKTRRALLQLNNFCMQRTFKTFSPWLHRHTNDVKMFTATWQISRKTNSFQRGYPRQTWVYHTSDCSNWVPNQLTAICVEPKPAAFDFWISLSLESCQSFCRATNKVGASKDNWERKRWSEQTKRTWEKYRKCWENARNECMIIESYIMMWERLTIG